MTHRWEHSAAPAQSALQLPLYLLVRVLDEADRPVAGIALMLTIHSAAGETFVLVPRLSDGAGMVRVDCAWVARAIAECRRRRPGTPSGCLQPDGEPRLPGRPPTLSGPCRAEAGLKVMSESEIWHAVRAQQYGAGLWAAGQAGIQELQAAANSGYEPTAVTVKLDVPGEVIRQLTLRLKKR